MIIWEKRSISSLALTWRRLATACVLGMCHRQGHVLHRFRPERGGVGFQPQHSGKGSDIVMLPPYLL